MANGIATSFVTKSQLMEQFSINLAGHEGQHVHDVHAGHTGHSGQVKNSSFLCILFKENSSNQKVLEVK